MLIRRVETQALWHDLPIGDYFSVSHLFFADASLLFQRATLEGALVLKSVVSKYEQLSGQKVSLEKSSVFFSKHAQWGDSAGLADMLGVSESAGDGKYLGLP